MATMPTWSRPLYARQQRRASVAFLVLHEGPLAPVTTPLTAEALGLASPDILPLIHSAEMSEETQPALFQALRQHPGRALAEVDLGGGVSALDRAQRVTTVTLDINDSPDLGYLQAGWACVRWLVERGGTLVQDLIAGRWWSAEEVRAQGQEGEFNLSREIRLLFDTDQKVEVSGRPEIGRVLNTRGMKKFARPDLVAVIREDALHRFEIVLAQLAQTLAMGLMPELPRHPVPWEGEPGLWLQPDDSTTVQRLLLHNDAWVLRTEQGHDPAFD
jgi:hypothetical protein